MWTFDIRKGFDFIFIKSQNILFLLDENVMKIYQPGFLSSFWTNKRFKHSTQKS